MMKLVSSGLSRKIILSILFILSFAWIAAERASVLPLKKISIPGEGSHTYLLNQFIAAGKKQSILYAVDRNAREEYELFSFKVNKRGNITKFTDTINLGEGMAYHPKAVFIDRSKVSAPAGKIKEDQYIILFYFFHEARYAKVSFYSEVFDINGKQIRGPYKYFEIEPSSGFGIENPFVRASVGPKSVAVVLYMDEDDMSYKYPLFMKTRIFFAEFDFDGEMLGNQLEVKLPNNCKNQNYDTGAAVYNGKGWLFPAEGFFFKTDYFPNNYASNTPTGGHLGIVAVKGKIGKRKVKYRRLFTDMVPDNSIIFSQPVILPDKSVFGATPAKAKDLWLLYRHVLYIPEESMKLEGYTVYFGMIPINSRGKKSGKAVAVDIPEWDHTITYDPAKEIYNHLEYFSRPFQMDNGKWLIFYSRSLVMWNPTKYDVVNTDDEQLISLYEIDTTGNVQVRAVRYSHYPGLFIGPLACYYGNSINYLTELITPNPALPTSFYFGSVKP
jgi:hypothetical protein